MDKEKQKEMKKNQELIDHYDYLKNAASSTDCTGLIPRCPNPRTSLMPTMMFINIRLHSSNQIIGDHTRLLFSNTPALQSR